MPDKTLKFEHVLVSQATQRISPKTKMYLQGYILWTSFAVLTSILSVYGVDPFFKDNQSIDVPVSFQRESHDWKNQIVVDLNDTEVKLANEDVSNKKFYYSVNSFKLFELAKQSPSPQDSARLVKLAKEYQKLAIQN
ncbi:MAG: hypothetical protein ACRCXZ_09410 [Patescibacteria group bacterium]